MSILVGVGELLSILR